MAKRKVITTPIPSIDTQWDDGINAYSGEAVEAFIKEQLKSKQGAVYFDDSEDAFITVVTFRSEADKAAWLLDKSNDSYVLNRQSFQVASRNGEGTAYVVALIAKSTGVKATTMSKKLIFPLRFTCKKATTVAGQTTVDDLVGTSGTVVVTARKAGSNGSYTKVTPMDGQDRYIDALDLNSTDFTNFDLGPFLQDGEWNYRISVVEPEKQTASSGISVTVNLISELRLQPTMNYYTPMLANTLSGFPISYTVYGTVEKTLHVAITGRGGIEMPEVTYTLGADVDSARVERTIMDSTNVYGLLSHGVRSVKAWLTCDDGQGGELTSNICENQYMMVNSADTEADLTKPYLLLQNVITQADNYAQTKLMDYAVFSPSVEADGSIGNHGKAVSVVFYLTNYSEKFPAPDVTEYFRIASVVSPGVANNLTTTIELDTDDAEAKMLNSYLRIWRETEGGEVDFMSESGGQETLLISIDNSDSFAPKSGADFMLNPKIRNNSESNPAVIMNSKKNNAVIESSWKGFSFQTDGWVTSDIDGQKILRIPAGASLNFKYNPFAQFLSTADSGMTLEIDFMARNVTNETDPIVSIFETIAGQQRGLVLKPLTGNIFTKSNTISDETDFSWREDVRTHITININNSISPDLGDALAPPSTATNYNLSATTIALCRVFINDNIQREIKYSITDNDEFCTGLMSNGGITLGQKGCDLDIYSIRCYTHAALDSQEVLDNHVSTLPTTEEKREMKNANSIITGGKIDINKVCPTDRTQPGKRALIWHGNEPFHQNTSAMKGWLEVIQYDNNGKYLPEYSGTICKATKSMKTKRQGSTANTYYYSNIQWKLGDIVDTIVVPVADFHESIVVSEPYSVDILDENEVIIGTKMVVDIHGGNLGKYDPVEAKPQQYDYTDKGVVVPDGWIDGNGKYRGKGYMVAEGTPLASKIVNKINYASSMQGHLTGVNNLYNDLHKAIVGENSLQKACKTARVSKYTEPFMWFTQADDASSPVYRGPCTFGAGKMDKPTWGYVKKLHPMFYMIEGSDNNAHLTDARVPFVYDDPTCSESIYYKGGDDEGYFYNGIQGLDFDAGATNDDAEESPKAALTNHIKEAWNFLYRHSPMLAYYRGTFDAFQKSDAAKNTTRKYWCTEGSDAYLLKRYDYKNSKWVDAGDTWDGTAWNKVDVRTDIMTAGVYTASANKANFAALNNELIGAIVAHAKKYLGFYFRIDSLKLYYTFVIHLLAGTDSCSKNTYFVCDPKAVSVTIDGETRECYLLEMHTDDVDTVLPIDNNGRGTKKYYIDRMHPYNDEDLTTNKYEGANNILFNLCELMWEGTRELQNMMQRIFTAMCDLVQESDTILGLPDSVAKKSVMGCLWKYIYSVMAYFPAVAFNEAARIRYEYPEMLGFTSSGPGARGIRPITQSNGNLLECELQFMARRLIYMGTYAAWGPFKDGKTGNIGIADASGAAQIQAFHLPGEETSNVNYTFKVKPHQYLYPVGMNGQTNVDPHVRVAPGEEFELNLGNTTSNDTGLSVLAANYLVSLGNIGDLSTNPNLTFTVNGKRLTEFKAVPSKTYQETDGSMRPAFRPQNIKFDAQNLRSIEITGMTGTSGELALSKLTRLETLKANDTGITSVTLPKTTSLQTLNLPAGLSRLELVDIPSLDSFSIDSMANLQNVLVDGATTGKLDTLGFVGKLRSESSQLKSMSIKNINWSSLPVAMLMWCAGISPYAYGATSEPYSLTGTATINQTAARLTYAYKKTLIEKYGNIDATSGVPLSLNYDKVVANAVSINGKSYIGTTGQESYNISVTPVYANNIAIATDADGNAVPDISFRFVDDDGNESTPTQYCNWEDAIRGLLNVVDITTEGNGRRYTLRATVGVITGGKRSEMEADLDIAFYVRHPKIGDYAYADGTFDDQFQKDKTIVGVVFKREPMYQGADDREPITYSGFDVPSDDVKTNKTLVGYRLLIDAKENAVIKSKDGVINTSSNAWGLYPEGSSGVYSTNGFPSATTGAHIAAAASMSSAYDTSIPNVGDGFSARYITTASFYDEEREDGFKEFSGNVIANSWNGYNFTQYIVQHMEQIFNNFLMDSANEDVETVWNEELTDGTTVAHVLNMLPTNLEELGDMMEILQKANGNLAIFRQFAYPAGYSCYLYEPSVRTDETLDPQYAQHKWYLPAMGELMRQFAFFAKSRTGVFTSNRSEGAGTVPNRSKIDALLLEAYNSDTSSFIRDNVSKASIEAGTYTTAEISKIEQWFQNLQECERPIYSMVLWRAAMKGNTSAFTNHSAGYHWSSSESSANYSWNVYFIDGSTAGTYKGTGFTVRPAVAYTFIL